MKTIDFKISPPKNISILALGPESAGNFSVYDKGKIFLSGDFGDLLEEKNFAKFKKEVLGFLRKNKIKPKAILTDLHPLYKTTVWGEELAEKFSAQHIKIQHHLAHIFSAIGEKEPSAVSRQPSASLGSKTSKRVGIACDGTGYGLDGKIWGGECFELSAVGYQLSAERIGHLENQVLIGGDLAIKEPARMLISVLAKFLGKGDVYKFVKKHYTRNQFELLYNQMKQGFNCQETSSTGRVLDAVSVLLGFSGNERKYKHEPIDLLEKNSANPYRDLKPKITEITPTAKNAQKGHKNLLSPKIVSFFILETTPLFEYLVKNLNKDKQRLAATAQLYLAEGLYQIISDFQFPVSNKNMNGKCPIFFSGGLANNKIMSDFFASKGAIMNKKIPRGDAGLSFGQIVYYLSANLH